MVDRSNRARRRNGRPGRGASSGDSLLELALVLPILLALCVGMIQFGMVLIAQNQLLFATREGVRQAALYGDPDVGMSTAMQNMISVPWASPRAILNGCSAYGQPCEAGMCADYNLVVPFVFSKTITLSAYAEALTERQSTTGANCADSLGPINNSSNCTVQHVTGC